MDTGAEPQPGPSRKSGTSAADSVAKRKKKKPVSKVILLPLIYSDSYDRVYFIVIGGALISFKLISTNK